MSAQQPPDRRRLLLAASAALGSVVVACHHAETCPPEQLSAADLDVRNKLHYTDHSPDPQKVCNGCQQYLRNSDKDCGACKVVKGPIHPNGYCAAFSAKG
jgi:hypothetical protein